MRELMLMIEPVFSKVTWIARGAAALMSLAATVMVMVTLAAPAAWAETLTVNTTADFNDGTCNPPPFSCTLREAVQISSTNGVPDTIGFASDVRGTITLGGPLTIASDSSNRVTINGPGANALAVSGNDASTVFEIRSGANAAINGLTIRNGAGFGGGGINNEGELVLNDSVVRDSESPELGEDTRGGGIRNTGTLTLNRSTVSGNFAALAGGISNEVTGVTRINQSTVSGNRAGFSGGGILNKGDLTLDRSTVNNNTAGTWGGGISSAPGPDGVTKIRNSTISGNTAAAGAVGDRAGNGGGIFVTGQTGIFHSTITDNDLVDAFETGNGLGSDEGPPGTATLVKSTIISGNADDNDVDLEDGSDNSIGSQGHNLIGGGNAVFAFDQTTDQTDITIPYLGPLADNGGPTLTHAILPNSRAIDSADPSSTLATDQRGVARPKDGDGNGSSRPDIGSYEKEPPPPNDDFARSVAVNSTSGSVNGKNIEATREAGEPDHAATEVSLGEKSVWYRWTAPASGTVSFDTCASSFDTILAVYTGSSLGSLNQIATNDDSCTAPNDFGSKLSFNASAGTTYRIAVSSFSANVQGTFTLRLPADTTAPRVRSTTPTSGATNVAPNANLFADFLEPMRADSINASTVTLRRVGSTQPLPATVSYASSSWRAALNPSANLQPGASYSATVTVGARDLAGNGLDQQPTTQGNQAKIWTFRVRP